MVENDVDMIFLNWFKMNELIIKNFKNVIECDMVVGYVNGYIFFRVFFLGIKVFNFNFMYWWLINKFRIISGIKIKLLINVV